MRSTIIRIFCICVISISCRKEHTNTPPAGAAKKILLKDITAAHLPSPYYHFEYRQDSMVDKVSFASDYTSYKVVYMGNNISEMRNNIVVNFDTLRYIYDNTGKVAIIKFINDAGVVYRHAVFTYDGQELKEVEWDHKEGVAGFIIDRTLSLVYFPDGNVKAISEHRPGIDGQAEATYVTQFDQYDNKNNVDDFMLLHDAFHDHLFLLPGVRIQKNNPRKEIRTGDGVNYIADYTYTYNNDSAPLTKTGDVLFTQGSGTGQRFQTNTTYTYY
jgi:hypothetical protein